MMGRRRMIAAVVAFGAGLAVGAALQSLVRLAAERYQDWRHDRYWRCRIEEIERQAARSARRSAWGRRG